MSIAANPGFARAMSIVAKRSIQHLALRQFAEAPDAGGYHKFVIMSMRKRCLCLAPFFLVADSKHDQENPVPEGVGKSLIFI
ncbi:hypothetical protein [Burkholderia plantarii]|uniref:hypothetical protein n=1 Tax=Burkholderia plantarii TaxID=41899 RepID=UPI0011DF2303|nr:hypothetical protein [Burkholderia plantarii]